MPRKTAKSVWNKKRYSTYRGKRKGAVNRKRAYAPKNKRRQVARSNPIAENKTIETLDIVNQVGRNALGNRIIPDYSNNPVYLNNEPPLDGTLDVANLNTGARGYPLTDSVYNLNPHSALYQTHGLGESFMVGSSVYQKICAMKLLIRWPQPTMNTGQWNGIDTDKPDNTDPIQTRLDWIANPVNNVMGVIPESPQSYHLYWGFIDSKLGLSDFTTPKKGEASFQNLEDHINKRIEQWFNQRTDRLQFIPKETSTLKIIGKKRLSPPWDKNSGRTPVSVVIEREEDPTKQDFKTEDGTIPDTLVKLTWPINRKIHFEETANFSGDGVASNGDPVSGTRTFFKNTDWLPFAIIVNWNANSLPKDGTHVPGQSGEGKFERTRRVPHILANDITYYRDS